MRYYSIYRPVSIGTYPNADDVTEIVNYDKRTYVDAINRPAFGHIEYTHELTIDEQSHYDLIPAITTDKNLEKVARTLWRYTDDEARFEKVWDTAKRRYGYTDDELATAFDQWYVYEKVSYEVRSDFNRNHPKKHPDFEYLDYPTPPTRPAFDLPGGDADTLDELMGAAYNPGEQMGLEMWANYRDAIAS